jgi:putative oxidoreductase
MPNISSRAPYAALLLRLALGVMFLAHAWLKVFVFTPAGFVKYFASLGLPAVAAYATLGLEVVGGLALIFGVFASWVALPLAAEMLGTVLMVHGKNGWLFTSPGGGWEYPMFWAIALVALFLLGDGAFALCPSFPRKRRFF